VEVVVVGVPRYASLRLPCQFMLDPWREVVQSMGPQRREWGTVLWVVKIERNAILLVGIAKIIINNEVIIYGFGVECLSTYVLVRVPMYICFGVEVSM
jgi:hypothetical protein